MLKKNIISTAACLLMAHNAAQAANIAIESSKVPTPIGPYSQAVLTMNGHMLFLSGNISLQENINDAATEIMGYIKELLKEADMDFRNVVKTTIYLTDMSNFSAVNSIYASYFAESSVLPARETVAVKALPKGAQVEISIIAVK